MKHIKKGIVLLSASLMLAACQSTTALDKAVHSASVQSNGVQKEMSQIDRTKTVQSRYDFDETIKRLESAISSKGMTLFATIDHAKAAKEAGLDMQPATVLVFGHPKAGTPLMKKDPTFALQLPLKVLVTEVDDTVLVSFNDTKALISGSKIDYADVEKTLVGAEMLITNTVTK